MSLRIRIFTIKLALALCVAGLVGALVNLQPYSLVWNRTASLPTGLYLAQEIKGTSVNRGDLACFPYVSPTWAKPRRYFVEGLRLCKVVTGLPGDFLRHEGEQWIVESPQKARHNVGALLPFDAQGRSLPAHALTEGSVPEGQLILIAPPQNSLDSRYLGPISQANITTKIRPIWVN